MLRVKGGVMQAIHLPVAEYDCNQQATGSSSCKVAQWVKRHSSEIYVLHVVHRLKSHSKLVVG